RDRRRPTAHTDPEVLILVEHVVGDVDARARADVDAVVDGERAVEPRHVSDGDRTVRAVAARPVELNAHARVALDGVARDAHAAVERLDENAAAAVATHDARRNGGRR